MKNRIDPRVRKYRLGGGVAGLLALLAASASVAAEEPPTISCSQDPAVCVRQPKVRIPPRYPEKCQPRAMQSESLFLKFDVTPEGRTENIRVVQATNECFSEASIESVSQWQYSKGAERLADVETRITFELAGYWPQTTAGEGKATCSIFEASKVSFSEFADNPALGSACQHEPDYPALCYATASEVETVHLTFSISRKGRVSDVAIDNPKNACLADFASRWLRRIEYAPSKKGFKGMAAVFRYEKAPEPATAAAKPGTP